MHLLETVCERLLINVNLFQARELVVQTLLQAYLLLFSKFERILTSAG
jgi:hypothetical protein